MASQTRGRRSLDAVTLLDRVARCRTGLRRLGVSRGDRVAAYAPNIDETLVAFLAETFHTAQTSTAGWTNSGSGWTPRSTLS